MNDSFSLSILGPAEIEIVHDTHRHNVNVCLPDWSLDYSDYLSLHLSLMRDSLLCMVNDAGTVGGYIKNPAHFKVPRSVELLTSY